MSSDRGTSRRATSPRGDTPPDLRLYPSDPTVPEEQFLGQMIPLPYHYNLLTDRERMSGFREAIRRLVQPGDKVVELGGGTGVLSFFAAQKASQVWLVERNPELVDAARRLLAGNRHGERVEVVRADACDFVPPEPVDVVICEMLHVALLREQQVSMVRAFRENHARRFAGRVPRFIPEVSFLAVQAVQQSFEFHGYHAPVPLFQAPGAKHEGTIGLSDPVIYETIDYAATAAQRTIPSRVDWQGRLTITREGRLNALRFVTKNVLAVLVEQGRTVEWSNQYLVLPLDEPHAVRLGAELQVAFSYPFGGSLDSLNQSIVVTEAPRQTRRAA